MTSAAPSKILHQSCVLLSGGMDSTAALHWAKANSRFCRAIGFAYGQQNRDRELTMAGRACEALGVEFTAIALAETLHTGVGIMRGIPAHDPNSTVTSRAFVPGRNAVFCTVAAAHAASWFPVGTIDLVVGACLDDANGFPDCRATFFQYLATAMQHGYDRHVNIHTPFVAMTKAQIVASASPEARRAIAQSWSCYAGGLVPCKACSACVLRKVAFDAEGVVDECAAPAMFGGDPHRMVKR